MQPWSIDIDALGRSIVRHSAAPRFIAQWTSGEIDLTAIDGVFWQDEGSDGGEDSVTLHSFQWIDTPPDQTTFEGLMKQAAVAIDDWIAKRF
jgi:hypothetical protein